MERARHAMTPLLDKRRVERQQAEQTLARALADQLAAATAVGEAEKGLVAHAAKRPRSEVRAQGTVTGVELARASAFAQRHLDQQSQLKLKLARAQQLLAERAGLVAQAQQGLARSSAGERAVEQHTLRADQELEKKRQRREQDALDEQAAARIIARRDPHL